jgi:hypothetical protein
MTYSQTIVITTAPTTLNMRIRQTSGGNLDATLNNILVCKIQGFV